MENQNGTTVKSNNPAPTVEQINADRITQVFIVKLVLLHKLDVFSLYWKRNLYIYLF